MAFGTSAPNLFSVTSGGGKPELDVTGASNMGLRLGQLRTANDPGRQFVEALKTRMSEDAKANQARRLFQSEGINVPDAGAFNTLMGGVQDPTDALKTISTIKQNDFTNQLNAAKIQSELAKAKAFSSNDGGDPLAEQYNALNEDGSIDFTKLPPGTSAYTDRYNRVRLRVQPNPIPNEWQANSIAGAEKFEPLVASIKELISGGALAGKDGSSNQWNKYLAEGGDSWVRRLLTPDNTPLEELASKRAELIKYAFSEGGKTLTVDEKRTVKAGLDFTGKSDTQISKDLEEAISILRRKGTLAVGGKFAASTFGGQSQQSSATQYVVGQVRKTKSGGTAKWDGQGWVPQ